MQAPVSDKNDDDVKTIKKPHTYFYDLEILRHNFTNAFVNLEHKVISVMVLDDLFDSTSEYDFDAIHKALQNNYPDYTVRPIMDMKQTDVVLQFFTEFSGATRRSEWFGWNSKSYDLIILATMMAYFERHRRIPTPRTIRRWSDMIIVEGARSIGFFAKQLSVKDYPEDFVKGVKRMYRSLTATQLHVDVGALNEKSGEDASKTNFPFPLKVMQSYVGLDVIDDDLVKGDGTPTPEMIEKGFVRENGLLTQKGLIRLLTYNINDVIATGKIFEEPEYKGALETRDTLRAEYPFLTKQKHEYGYLYQLSRDATSSQYAGKIIRGKYEAKLEDIPEVSFKFPFADGKWYNVLDYIEKHEKNINPRVVEFYRHFEGKNTASKEDYALLRDSSLTGKSTINVPYVDKNGRATSAYITPSLGGSHGGIVSNTYGRNMYDERDKKWFIDFETMAMNNVVATVDVKNIIHVDFASYYPTMNIKLGVYKTGDTDNYFDVRKNRYALKGALTDELRATNIFKYNEIDDRQNALKLVLNGATGASNQHNPNADLPLDNATLSMRIIGNLFIYTLGQKFSNIGGLVISTNTDGLYVANISMEQANEVVKEFYDVYGLELEPEYVVRMINKSANERIEITKNKKTGKVGITSVGGNLKRSLKNRVDLSSKINYPRASGKAVLNYIYNRETWLQEPIDMKYLRELVKEQLNDFHPIDWTITLKGNNDRKFFIEDVDNYEVSNSDVMFNTNVVPLQNTNRIVMVKEGHRIMQTMKGKQEKITGLTSTKVKILNWQRELEDVDSYINELDIDAYTQWAFNLLDTWHNTSVIPELDGVEKELQEQLTLDDLF